jgi:NADP-dependent 3-hydroxy acid dehydrogenase YdfG
MLRANVAGTVNAIRAVVPGMVARDRGHVVNLGSIAATFPAPGSPAYAATKAAVHSLSQNLRLDLFGSRVRVTEICPGRVRTGIHAGYVGGDAAKAEEAFYRGYECLEPEDIASAVLFALDAPPRMDVTYMEILPTLQVYGGGDFLRTGPAAGDDEDESAATGAAPRTGTRPAPRTRPSARRRPRR